jgi:CHASE3 domain sensor protein
MSISGNFQSLETFGIVFFQSLEYAFEVQTPQMMKALTTAMIAVALTAVLGVALLVHRTSVVFEKSTTHVEQFSLTVTSIHDLIGLLSAAEAGQRGYIASGVGSYLEAATNALRRVEPVVVELDAQLAHTSTQQAVRVEFRNRIAERIELLRSTLDLERSGHHQDAIDRIRAGRGMTIMNQVRDLAERLVIEQEDRLRSHQERLATTARNNVNLSYIAIILSLLIAAIIALLLLRLRNIETLVTICAWTKTIKYDGEWISFEEYLKRRFGIQATHGISEKEFARVMKQQGIDEEPPAT